MDAYTRFRFHGLIFVALCILLSRIATATEAASSRGSDLYHQLKIFSPTYSSLRAENVIIKKDRATLTFRDGTFYLPAPVEGKIRGAVFIGNGSFQADAPPNNFEKEDVKRLLRAEDVSSDFKTAVLRFTDDTDTLIGPGTPQGGPPPEQAIKLATGVDRLVLEESGANLSARLLLSIMNQESPGFFFAEFDGGRRGRFAFLLDYQARIPVANFSINAGERGLIYAFDKSLWSPQVWMAFFLQDDYQQGRARYADTDDLILIPKYALQVDVTKPKKLLGVVARMSCVAQTDALVAIPFVVGEDLDYSDEQRRKKQLRVLSAHLGDGTEMQSFQEPWEGGFTVVLPAPVVRGQQFTVEVSLVGEFMFQSDDVAGTYFPLRTTSWYPRHGYLRRSLYETEFRHRKNDVVASVGITSGSEASPDDRDQKITRFRLEQPVALTSFSVGPYEIHKDVAKMPNGRNLPVEFYSMPGSRVAIKEDFIVAELSNCVRYFSALFGEYPYGAFRGVYHPFAYGQGFPTTLMIPATDHLRTFQFIAHETAHQWWGDNVAWRSYRDQWLSEGFAEYSGLLYAQTRDNKASERELIERARLSLRNPPVTPTGIAKGRLVDVGPLVMGHRLSTRETGGAYTALIYDKGALVLRMLHFLFTDPQSGIGGAFFEMMSDFVRQHAGGAVSTDDFFAIANAHVGQTVLARKYGYKDLDWFYKQWVLEAYLPSYRLDYVIENQPDGSSLLKGTLSQDGLPESEHWFMPLPLMITFSKNNFGIAPVAVLGKESPVRIKLPTRPQKVELDPDLWVLSEKTSTIKR